MFYNSNLYQNDSFTAKSFSTFDHHPSLCSYLHAYEIQVKFLQNTFNHILYYLI